MFYLSQLINAAVENANGERIGKFIDVLVFRRNETGFTGESVRIYPHAILIEGEEDHFWRVPPKDIERIDHTLRVRVPLDQFSQQPAEANEQEVSLVREVLDKQVIDIEHKKAIRVNDIGIDDDWCILGVDNSNLGLVRRIAPPWLVGKGRTTTLIPWQEIELLDLLRPNARRESSIEETSSIDRLGNIPVARTESGHLALAEMHPADIAEIVHQLTPGQGAHLIERLDNETAAATMEEIDTERQRQILENIQPSRAADILEAMGPDEAADLLSELPEERTEELLRLMQPEESEDVQELLEYEEDTAGGMMTTDYVAINQTRTVTEAMEAIRTNIRENGVRIAYVYCVADETQDECSVLGVVSLWDLLVAAPTQILQDIMETDIIAVQPNTDARTVSATMAKYNLLALPVVNEHGILEGVVTVDDALDVLLPNERRRKPRRMY